MAKRQTTFLLKRSNIPGKIPPSSGLTSGELALNTADAILYTSGSTSGTILPIGWDRVSRTGDTMTGSLYSPSISATTISATTYLNLPPFSGDYLPLSGGTVYGNSYFTNGLTANTLNVTGLTQTNGITSTGGVTFKQVTINSTYSATTQDYMIDVTGGTFTVYLPSAVGIQGRLLVIKNNGGGAVTVQPILGQDIDGKPLVILGETNTIQLASNGSEWVAISYNISTVNSSTGVFEFTGLTIASPTTFTVAPVKGWIVDDTTNPLSPQLYYVVYSGGTHTATYVTTATETWVYLTSGGTISQSNIELTEQQRRENIFLGKLGHANKTNIINAFSQPDFVLSPLSQLRDMFTPINLINGGVYASPNGVNLSFNTSAGYLYGLGINFASSTLNPNTIYVSGNSPTTFQYRTQTGGTSSNTTFIDPTKYDVGGVVTSISGTKATNQRIYLVQNGIIRVQYGQTEYQQLTAAIEGIATEQFNTFSNFTNNGILIGVLSVLSTATDLSDTSKARFFFTSKFGETVGSAGGVSTTTLQQAYNNSVNPEITTNSTLGALSIKNGTGNNDNVTNLIEGLNTAGNTTSFIRYDGYISGTTVVSNTISATTVTSSGNISGFTLVSTQSINDEGGEIKLATPQTNSTLNGGNITFDVYQNRLRFFESGGSNRGVYIDLTAASTGVGTNLLSGGGGEINTASNLGAGTGLFAQKSAADLQFKSLTSTGGTVTISNDANTVNLEVIPSSNFTGGTVTGSTIFTNGLSANTISATTYQNLPFSGNVIGNGTANYLPKWTGTTGLSNSIIQDNGTNI